MKRKRYSLAILFCSFSSSQVSLRQLFLSTNCRQNGTSSTSPFLASDQLKGRGNGSPELERAADYIASQFRSYGLQPAGDGGTYFQKFDVTIGAEFGTKNAPSDRRRLKGERTGIS